MIEACFSYAQKGNDAYAFLRKEANQKIKEKLAAHPCTTAKILLALSREDDKVRGRLAQNENTPASALSILVSEAYLGEELRIIAQNPNATEEIFWKIRTSQNHDRKKIIKGKSPKAWDTFLDSISFDTAELDLIDRKLTEAQRAQLQRGGLRARLFLATDLCCPESIMEEMLGDPDNSSWDLNLLPFILNHPNTTDALREALYNNKRESFKQQLAASPKTSAQLLERLSRDRDVITRSNAAENPSTPASCLKQLLKDRDVGVKTRVAKNPSISEELFALMANDKNPALQSAAAENERCPTQLLLQLSTTKHVWVLRSLLENPNTPPEAFRLICEKAHWRKDEEWRPHFRETMRRHPAFPAALLPVLNKRS